MLKLQMRSNLEFSAFQERHNKPIQMKFGVEAYTKVYSSMINMTLIAQGVGYRCPQMKYFCQI